YVLKHQTSDYDRQLNHEQSGMLTSALSEWAIQVDRLMQHMIVAPYHLSPWNKLHILLLNSSFPIEQVSSFCLLCYMDVFEFPSMQKSHSYFYDKVSQMSLDKV